jgi:hypothetical protein
VSQFLDDAGRVGFSRADVGEMEIAIPELRRDNAGRKVNGPAIIYQLDRWRP